MGGPIIAAVIGGVILLVGAIWLVIIAFRESTSCGLLYMFLPFYSIYYAITRWSETKKPFLIGLIGVIALIGGLVPTIIQTVTQVKSEVEPVITEFMEAGVAKDVDRAYSYCLSSVSKEELARLITNNYELFEGFEDVTTSSLSVQTSAGITTAECIGTIIYSSDRRLPFEATLVKENSIWRITGFHIGY